MCLHKKFSKNPLRQLENNLHEISGWIPKILHYKCHKVNLNWGGSYIDSLEYKTKKATTNPINKSDDKWF